MRLTNNRSWIFIFLIFLICVGDAHAFLGPLAPGAHAVPLADIKVSLATPEWNDDGGVDLAVSVNIKNVSGRDLRGELRTTMLAFNGRIDFDKVRVRAVHVPDSYHRPEDAPVHNTFFVAPDYALKNGAQDKWSFKITLPAGVKERHVPLQILVFYHGQHDGRQWLSKGATFLPVAKD